MSSTTGAAAAAAAAAVTPVTLREPGADLQRVWFWPAAVGMATVTLVLFLGFAWYALLVDRRADLPFPPAEASCPDGWRRQSDGACKCQGVNAGLLAADALVDPGRDPALQDARGRRDWARRTRVMWDGVTTD